MHRPSEWPLALSASAAAAGISGFATLIRDYKKTYRAIFLVDPVGVRLVRMVIFILEVLLTADHPLKLRLGLTVQTLVKSWLL